MSQTSSTDSPTGSETTITDQYIDYAFIDFSCRTSWLDPTPPPLRAYKPAPLPEAQLLLKSCVTGDLKHLKRIVRKLGEKSETSPTIGSQMLQVNMMIAAITHKQSTVLEWLLLEYPFPIYSLIDILSAALEHPHYQTFRLLHACAPGIVDTEMSQHTMTLFEESCHGGNPLIPDCLIECGADLNVQGF